MPHIYVQKAEGATESSVKKWKLSGGGALLEKETLKSSGLTIPLLGTYPKKTVIQKDVCSLRFIVALFTIARTWKQPRRPLTEEWIKMWYIHIMEYLLSHKRTK